MGKKIEPSRKTPQEKYLHFSNKLICKVCQKRFSRSDNLRTHQRVHTGEMPFSCKFCGQRFRWVSALTNHQDLHELKGTVAPFQPSRMTSTIWRNRSLPTESIDSKSSSSSSRTSADREERKSYSDHAKRRSNSTRSNPVVSALHRSLPYELQSTRSINYYNHIDFSFSKIGQEEIRQEEDSILFQIIANNSNNDQQHEHLKDLEIGIDDILKTLK